MKQLTFKANGTTKYGCCFIERKATIMDSAEETLIECMKKIPKYFSWESIEFDFTDGLHYYISKEWLFETCFDFSRSHDTTPINLD